MKIHTTTRLFVSSFLMMLLCVIAASAQSGSSSGYHVIKQINAGGEGGWDYLTMDSDTHRLYVSRGSHVMVIDVDAGKVVGDLTGTAGVHGIALASEYGKGFTSNGRSDSVTIFDLKTLKVLGEAKTGKNPDAIIYDPSSHRVFVFNGGSQNATAIDARSGEVAGTIALGGRPEFVAADERGHVYVNLEDKSEVVALDSKKLAVEAHWPLAPGEEPSGMAMDRKHRRLFIGCRNKMMVVMNADTGRVVTTVTVGNGVDANAFDPETNFAFSSNGDGTLTVVHEDSPDKFSVTENVTTQKGSRTMALDAKTHKVYLAAAQYGATPAATAERPRPRPSMVPGSFSILVLGR